MSNPTTCPWISNSPRYMSSAAVSRYWGLNWSYRNCLTIEVFPDLKLI